MDASTFKAINLRGRGGNLFRRQCYELTVPEFVTFDLFVPLYDLAVSTSTTRA
jgi:hypothetical protein